MGLSFGQGVFGRRKFGGGPAPVPVPPASVVFTGTGYAATIALDPGTGDLALSGLKVIKGDDAILQKVQCVLKFWKGEWFLDTRQGMPYVQQILAQKSPSLPALRSIFRRALLKVRQIVSVQSIDITVGTARQGFVNFVALLDDGRTLTATQEPFIV